MGSVIVAASGSSRICRNAPDPIATNCYDPFHWLPAWRWTHINDLWTFFEGEGGITNSLFVNPAKRAALGAASLFVSTLFWLASVIWEISLTIIKIALNPQGYMHEFFNKLETIFAPLTLAIGYSIDPTQVTDFSLWTAIAVLAFATFGYQMWRRGPQEAFRNALHSFVPLAFVVVILGAAANNTEITSRYKSESSQHRACSAPWDMTGTITEVYLYDCTGARPATALPLCYSAEHQKGIELQTLQVKHCVSSTVGSPRWLFQTTISLGDVVGNALGVAADGLSNVTDSTQTDTYCDSYIASLEDISLSSYEEAVDANFGSGSIRGRVPIMISRMWYQAYLTNFGRAQFGSYQSARKSMCLVAEAQSNHIHPAEIQAVWDQTCNLSVHTTPVNSSDPPGVLPLYGCDPSRDYNGNESLRAFQRFKPRYYKHDEVRTFYILSAACNFVRPPQFADNYNSDPHNLSYDDHLVSPISDVYLSTGTIPGAGTTDVIPGAEIVIDTSLYGDEDPGNFKKFTNWLLSPVTSGTSTSSHSFPVHMMYTSDSIEHHVWVERNWLLAGNETPISAEHCSNWMIGDGSNDSGGEAAATTTLTTISTLHLDTVPDCRIGTKSCIYTAEAASMKVIYLYDGPVPRGICKTTLTDYYGDVGGRTLDAFKLDNILVIAHNGQQFNIIIPSTKSVLLDYDVVRCRTGRDGWCAVLPTSLVVIDYEPIESTTTAGTVAVYVNNIQQQFDNYISLNSFSIPDPISNSFRTLARGSSIYIPADRTHHLYAYGGYGQLTAPQRVCVPGRVGRRLGGNAGVRSRQPVCYENRWDTRPLGNPGNMGIAHQDLQEAGNFLPSQAVEWLDGLTELTILENRPSDVFLNSLPEAREAQNTAESVLKMHGSQWTHQALQGALALGTAVVYALTLVGLSVGTLLAQFILGGIFIVLPLVLVVMAIPTKAAKGLPLKLFKLTVGALLSHTIFLSLLAFVILFTAILISVVDTVGVRSGGWAHTIILAAVPIMGIKLVGALTKQFGMDITSLKGAVSTTSGMAMASMKPPEAHPYRYAQGKYRDARHKMRGFERATAATGVAGGAAALGGAAGIRTTPAAGMASSGRGGSTSEGTKNDTKTGFGSGPRQTSAKQDTPTTDSDTRADSGSYSEDDAPDTDEDGQQQEQGGLLDSQEDRFSPKSRSEQAGATVATLGSALAGVGSRAKRIGKGARRHKKLLMAAGLGAASIGLMPALLPAGAILPSLLGAKVLGKATRKATQPMGITRSTQQIRSDKDAMKLKRQEFYAKVSDMPEQIRARRRAQELDTDPHDARDYMNNLNATQEQDAAGKSSEYWDDVAKDAPDEYPEPENAYHPGTSNQQSNQEATEPQNDTKPPTSHNKVDGARQEIEPQNDTKPPTSHNKVDGARQEIEPQNDTKPPTSHNKVDGARQEIEPQNDTKPPTSHNKVDGARQEIETLQTAKTQTQRKTSQKMQNLREELNKRKLQGVPNDAPPIREIKNKIINARAEGSSKLSTINHQLQAAQHRVLTPRM